MTVNCLSSPENDGKRLVVLGMTINCLSSPEYDDKRFIVTGTTVKGLQALGRRRRERVVTHDKRSGPAPN